MKKNTQFYPLTAVLFGALGFAARLLQLKNGFEPDTGLALSGNLYHGVMIGITVAVLAFFLFYSARVPKKTDLSYGELFSAADPMRKGLSVAGGALTAAGGLLLLAEAIPQRSILDLLLGVLCLLSGGCLIPLAAPKNKIAYSLLPSLPAFTSYVWLIDVYRANTANPTVLEYAWYLLAAAAVLLAYYAQAGFPFQNGKPRFAVCTAMLAVFFSLTALADPVGVPCKLLLGGSLFWHLSALERMLSHLQHPETAVLPQTSPETDSAPSQPEEDDEDDADIIL